MHRLFTYKSPSQEINVLEKIAELGAFIEKTAHWHTGYGLLLKSAWRYDGAIVEYQQAVDMDKMAWKALQGLAQCYANLEDYDKGTTFLNQALAVVPETFKSAVREIRADLIVVMLKKGDLQASLQYSKAGFEEEPDDESNAKVYVHSLYALFEFKRIVEILQGIQNRGESVFVRFTSVIHEFCRACRSQHAMSLVEPEFQQFLYDGSPFIPYTAVCMYQYLDSTDEAIRLLEKSLNPTVSDMVLPQYNQMHTSGIYISRMMLSMVYYGKAVGARLAGQDPTEWENKLKEIAIASKDNKTWKNEYGYSFGAPALTYGIYLRKHAEADPETWMPWIRNSLLMALDMLCDDDPINDLDAYHRCMINLIAAGDFPNALAAAAVCLMPLSMTDSSWLAAARKLHFTKHRYTCDGLCTTSDRDYNLDYQELRACVECINTCTLFCEVCYKKLLDGELFIRVCDPKHEMVQIYPVPEEAKGVAAKFDGEKMIVQQEWLDELRKKWTYDTSQVTKWEDSKH
jgi:tetratricopeptide (TPR) repeat protein